MKIRTIRKIKLISENLATYEKVLPGFRLVYSRNVIRLASEAISVPVPPIFTPRSKSK